MLKNRYKIFYCSNIFKEDDWKKLFNKLNNYVVFFKKNNMQLSLCFSRKLVEGFLSNKLLFENWLKKNRIEISSLNGFVYTKFHKNFIKDDIYYPDWTSRKRLDYTLNLIFILNDLMLNSKFGSISTLPLSYTPWIKKKHIDYVLYKSFKNLLNLYPALFENNKTIHIDIEPEPTCLIDSIKKFIKYFNFWFIPLAKKIFFKKFNINKKKAVFIIRKYFRLCYDISHSSVNFDNHLENIVNLKKYKIKIGKVQISSAKEFFVKEQNEIENFIKETYKIKNSSFLHQVSEKKDEKIIIYKDLTNFLDLIDKKNNFNIRIHFHAPLFEDKNTTQYDTKKALLLLFKFKSIKHFEIETYTFSSLTKKKQFDFVTKEYNWLKSFIKSELC